ncbi:hypothetical protein [Sphingomonas adhaesiva]|uniref:hypothetical protein n=1 Tax=Sphingomonas adhaesiva TaxID=28212 RepID=UPI002FFC8A73
MVLAPLMLVSVHPANAAEATEPAKRVRVAALNFASHCPIYEGYADARDSTPGGGLLSGAAASLGNALFPAAAGLAGDAVKAGLDVIGGALEDASRAQAFSVEGRTVYPFYRVEFSRAEAPLMTAVPREGCLILKLRAPVPQGTAGLMPDVPATEGAVSEDVQEGSGSESEVGDTASQSTDVGSEYGDEDLGFTKEQLAGIKTGHNGDYTNKAILGRLLLSMEIKVHASTEAVFFEPVYIRYNAPISGAPKSKPLPAEIHVSLTTAAVEHKSTVGAPFAVARIPLPPLRVGDRWFSDQMGVTSGVVPLRPRTGTLADLDAGLAKQLAEHADKVMEVSRLEAQEAFVSGKPVPDGQAAESDADSLPFTVDDVVPLAKPNSTDAAAIGRSIADLKKDIAGRRAILRRMAAVYPQVSDGEDLMESPGLQLGATAADVRLVLVKNENQFGMAIAKALKDRTAAVGNAFTNYLTADKPPEWTEADGQYFTAVADLQTAEKTLADARAAGDGPTIEAARTALLNARIALNVKAVAVKRPPPYPNPIVPPGQ